MEFSAKQIAEFIQGVIVGDENATVHTFAKIEEGVFSHCDSLSGIYFQSPEPPIVGENVFLNCPENMVVYYPDAQSSHWDITWLGFSTESWDPSMNPFYPGLPKQMESF